MKKTFKIIGFAILLLLLFRGAIFRFLVNYKVVGTRVAIEITNQALIDKIDAKSNSKTIDLQALISIANAITCETLSFTTGKASVNPNQLIITQKANCVGYAAMFNAIATQLIDEHHLQQTFKVEHCMGKLDLLGYDLHQLFDSPFFKDHDFNQLTILKTGEKVAIDVSVNDYLWIDRVDSK